MENQIILLFLLVVTITLVNGNRLSKGKLFKYENRNSSETEAVDGGNRKGKLFSLFNVVTFANLPCASTQTTNGVSRNGTCFTATECSDKGGTTGGNCASGFGVCCVFVYTSSTTISQNCSYIQNSGFPTAVTTTSSQSFTVSKCSSDVCFLRLDFETFTLVGTNGSSQNDEGTCIDTFAVSTPTAMIIPTICGQNRGQHMYVDLGATSTDTATIAIATAATTADRFWDIKITQVECTNAGAPRDSSCLQYHTGYTGRFTSFNYDNTNDNHLNSQQYSICIRQEAGFCCLEYSVCPDQTGTITGGAPAGWSFDTTQNVARTDSNCADAPTNSIDHLGIDMAGSSCSPAGTPAFRAINNRWCGFFLNAVGSAGTNAPICDCTGPFQVDVYFNAVSDQNAATGNPNTLHSRGFCLEYKQIPC